MKRTLNEIAGEVRQVKRNLCSTLTREQWNREMRRLLTVATELEAMEVWEVGEPLPAGTPLRTEDGSRYKLLPPAVAEAFGDPRKGDQIIVCHREEE